MTKEKNITVEAREGYIDTEAIATLLENNGVEEGTLIIFSVNQSLGSGYGTWVTTIDTNAGRFNLTHHNEEWFYSQKELYNEQYDHTPESEANHDMSVYRCVESNINGIIDGLNNLEDEQ